MPAKASKIMIIRHAEKPTGHFAGVNCGLPVDGCEDDVFAQAGGLHLDDVSVGEALLGSGRHGRDDGCDEKDNRSSKDPGSGMKDPPHSSKDPGSGMKDPPHSSKDPGSGMKDPPHSSKDPGSQRKDPPHSSKFPGGAGPAPMEITSYYILWDSYVPLEFNKATGWADFLARVLADDSDLTGAGG
jgi:hypothetical protein